MLNLEGPYRSGDNALFLYCACVTIGLAVLFAAGWTL